MKRDFLFLLCLSIILSACGPGPETATVIVPEATTEDAVSEPQATLEPTPEPAIIGTVNGEGITESSYQISLAQLNAQLTGGADLLVDGQTASQRVIDDLVNRMLLAQGARVAGFQLDNATLEARLNTLTDQMGGAEALSAWQSANGYDAQTFRAELALEIEAGWMREQISASVPESAEQVLARQVFFWDSFSAERILSQLDSGVPFQQVVNNNDPQDTGYIGWFAQGTLFLPEVEAAAFALQPGEYSEVIQSTIGYHILEVLDRQTDRPLTPDARLTLIGKALDTWLASQRAASSIDVTSP
jgi:peptidyl-prolyl cis-trans isomerase C